MKTTLSKLNATVEKGLFQLLFAVDLQQLDILQVLFSLKDILLCGTVHIVSCLFILKRLTSGMFAIFTARCTMCIARY